MKAARADPDHPIFVEFRERATDDDIARQEQRIKDIGATTLSVRKMSKRADLHRLYTGIYALLSSSAHSGVRDIETYFVEGADGVDEIDYAPAREHVPSLLLMAGDFVLLGSDFVCRHFEITDFAATRRELSELVNTITTDLPSAEKE